jgi:phosphopantetheine--protein transferase-like protein
MPLFYQQNINDTTRLAIWKIEETEEYFSGTVPVQREITHAHKRLQHLAGRYLLRFLFPDFPYQEIEIATTRKPFLPNEQYHFSISHCGDYAAAIVSKSNRVGVDVEIATERVMKIVKKFLHEEEISNFKFQISNAHIQHMTLLWSCKEAIFKWWGNGEVDFSEMIRIESFELANKGNIDACFHKTLLKIEYELFNKLCLAWVIS